jgi:hypothetical protein
MEVIVSRIVVTDPGIVEPMNTTYVISVHSSLKVDAHSNGMIEEASP